MEPSEKEPKSLPRFEELVGKKVLEKGIIDPSHVMAVLKLDENTRAELEKVEKAEVDVSTKNTATVYLAELATRLKMKYGYTLDVELVSKALYHLVRGLNLYSCEVVAYYWPECQPVVFLLDQEIALVVAPKVE